MRTSADNLQTKTNRSCRGITLRQATRGCGPQIHEATASAVLQFVELNVRRRENSIGVVGMGIRSHAATLEGEII